MDKRGSFVVNGSVGVGLLFTYLFKKKKGNYAIVCNNQYSAQKTYEFILNFLNEDEVVFFPSDELLRAESLSTSRELMAQRLYAMSQLLKPAPKILVTHPSALHRYLPDPKKFQKAVLNIRVGARYNLDDLKSQLLEMGYNRVNKVDQSLLFASRGDILDIFSVNYQKPIRIEFFGDEVDSIRYFDVGTQCSEKPVKEIEILPATDMYLTDEEINEFTTKLTERLALDSEGLPAGDKDLLNENVLRDLENIVGRNYSPASYKYYGMATELPHSILSYFWPTYCFVADKEGFAGAVSMLEGESSKYYRELYEARRIPTHLQHYMKSKEALAPASKIIYGTKFQKYPEDPVFTTRSIITAATGIAGIVPTVQSYLETNSKVVIALVDDHQISTVKSFLNNANVDYEDVQGTNLPLGKLGITKLPLSSGFELPGVSVTYISSTEIFGKKSVSSRFSSRFKSSTILKSFEDLRPGDYVVHEYNGIGQFIEIKTMEVDGVHRDYLRIAYAGNETLYVPLEQFRLVRKYAGREGAAPRLSHLSTGDWKKKKAKIQEKMDELADRLLELYSNRVQETGFAFPPDDELQKRFEDEFPYELTSDQAKSLEQIKADMESDKIMDRLLCGDVGFGKTEVALRAAFKAICAGKQVAILCPTTLLARQHYENALQRFATFGVHIAQFSRLIPEARQKIDLDLLIKGKIDLAIGTHRILSKDVKFNNLGLLIVDEEQRFGVEQKEKIKELKHSVDVLTLSATPIPRTLQMSLIGIRPMSEINTAPASRMPIQTYVTPYKEDVVFELIARELSRSGQVFYVHNVVATIYNVASKIASHVPEASIGVIHGKMDKNDVEDVMSKFYDGEINVLVATSIVENGIDVPNANMIIVEDSDKFGLSQLYQIKGRVGRGDRIAYAYLLYKPQKNMNEDAQKRLKAIQDFTELGSGFKIAQRDLMIRGAGDILGAEQAGFIDSIGLDLYLKMLNETIQAKQTGVVKEPPKPRKVFNIDAYIPSGFAENSDKIELYQELETAENEEQITSIAKKMRQVYGKLPKEADLLIQKKRIDILGSSIEFAGIEETKSSIDITMDDCFSRINGIGQELFNAMVPYLNRIRVTFVEKKLRIRLEKKPTWFNDLESILRLVHTLYMSHKA